MTIREEMGSEAVLISDGPLKYLRFKGLEKYKSEVEHCMSTRRGGTSQGRFESMNLGFNRGDPKENVESNFRVLCSSAGIDAEGLVFSDQVHGCDIRLVGEQDRGKGLLRESDIKGCDGLMTNVPGVALVTFYADCVPVFLYDRVKKAIALVHSGWKGTLLNIAAHAAERMGKEFNTQPEDIVTVIGPSIGKCCFEVGRDVFSQFAGNYDMDGFHTVLGNGKMKIDLQGIIKSELEKKGLPEENIHLSDICTVCRKDLFFSYRGDGGKTGSLAAFMQIK